MNKFVQGFLILLVIVGMFFLPSKAFAYQKHTRMLMFGNYSISGCQMSVQRDADGAMNEYLEITNCNNDSSYHKAVYKFTPSNGFTLWDDRSYNLKEFYYAYGIVYDQEDGLVFFVLSFVGGGLILSLVLLGLLVVLIIKKRKIDKNK